MEDSGNDVLKLINNSVKEVWVPGLNKRRFRPILPVFLSISTLVFVSVEEIYQTLEAVFHQLSEHLFSVFGYPIETLSLVFDILLPFTTRNFQRCKWKFLV